ncbi:MAG: WD40 repeat domain-containing protein [Gammaproteobacteria bacterium]|nr:WD40 repeat domain-containing protein [Gammaproteobacteria bacterium]
MTETDKEIVAQQEQLEPWACSAQSRKHLEHYGNTRRHTVAEDPGPFRKLSLSNDGNTLAAATRRVLCLFNTRTRERLERFAFDCDIAQVTINGDGQIIFVADTTNAIHVIDVPFSYRSKVFTHRADIVAMTIDSGGSRLAVADATGCIKILDTANFSNISTLDCGYAPQRLVIRLAEDLLLCFGKRKVIAHQLATGKRLARYGNDEHIEDSFCLPGEYLVTEAPGGFVVFNSEATECRYVPTPTCKAFDTTPDGAVFTTTRRNGLILWDASRGAEIRDMQTYIREVGDIKICDEGQSVYVCGDDATVECFSVTGERLATFSDFYSPIMAAATTNNDRTLIVADETGTLAVYDLVDGTASRFPQHTCCISKLHVEGSLVATGAHDCRARVLDLDSGKEVFSVYFPGAPVQAITLDGDRFVGIGNYLGQVQLYDLDNHQLAHEFYGNRSSVRSLSLSPCRRYLMSTNESGEVLIFNYGSGELINQLNGSGIIYSGCFDETGEFVYFGDGKGRIRKARPTSPKILRCWSTHGSDVRSVHVRGNRLSSIGIFDKAQVLDLDSGKTLLDCPVNAKPYHRVAFMNAGGTRLVTGGQDGCLMFHDASDGSVQAELHNLAHGYLWLTRDDDSGKAYGDSFWTDQEELISVYNRVAGIEALLLPSSEAHQEYIRIHKNRGMTMSRVGMTPAATDPVTERLLATRHSSIMDCGPSALLEQLPD